MISGTLLNLLFPSTCPSCKSASDSHTFNPFCTSCWKKIKRYTGPACRVCGIPTVSPHTSICAQCLTTPPPFSKVLFYGIYEGILREAIHCLKFKGVRRLSMPLSRLLEDLPIPEVDLIVPVPLHKENLQNREFNQSALIARHLSRKLLTPLHLTLLKKPGKTPAQTEVSGKERLRNLRNVFGISGDFERRTVLLVDDVITTGATVTECAETLRRAGARQVTVIALARSAPIDCT